MLSLGLFFLLISSGSFFVTAKYDRRYEEMLPLTIFSLVLCVFLFGLVDLLRVGVYLCCLLAAVLCGFSVYYIIKKKKIRAFLKNTITPAFVIYLAVAVVFAVSIVGLVAFKGDEFSFWASSVKKTFYLERFHCIPEAEPYFSEYPPGMQIFQYVSQVLNGEYSEWRNNFAYMVYVFALYLPFLKNRRHRNVLLNILSAVIVFCSGTIVFSDALENLMIDFALGATFAYAMARVFLISKTDNGWSLLDLANIIMSAQMLVLLKSVGKLLAFIVLFALAATVLKDSWKKINVRAVFQKKTILALLVFVSPLIVAMLWKLKYSSYDTHIAFDAGNYDLKEFFEILTGGGSGYRVTVKNNFFSFLCNEKISFGFLNITNLQLYLLLVAGMCLLYCYYKRENLRGSIIAISTIAVGMIVYVFGLLASYMYTFIEIEGVALASMQRYLNIFICGIILMIVFTLLAKEVSAKQDVSLLCGTLAVILCFTSSSDVYRHLSGEIVQYSNDCREPFEVLENQIRTDVKKNPLDEKGTVMLVYQAGTPHVPVNHFTYILWPDFIVPWECGYGTQPLYEGDGYTQILSSEEYQAHIKQLGVDYIAICLLNDDYINAYGHMFDHPLQNGQVYRVVDSEQAYQLITE